MILITIKPKKRNVILLAKLSSQRYNTFPYRDDLESHINAGSKILTKYGLNSQRKKNGKSNTLTRQKTFCRNVVFLKVFYEITIRNRQGGLTAPPHGITCFLKDCRNLELKNTLNYT